MIRRVQNSRLPTGEQLIFLFQIKLIDQTKWLNNNDPELQNRSSQTCSLIASTTAYQIIPPTDLVIVRYLIWAIAGLVVFHDHGNRVCSLIVQLCKNVPQEHFKVAAGVAWLTPDP